MEGARRQQAVGITPIFPFPGHAWDSTSCLYRAQCPAGKCGPAPKELMSTSLSKIMDTDTSFVHLTARESSQQGAEVGFKCNWTIGKDKKEGIFVWCCNLSSRQWCQTLERKSAQGSELTWCNTLKRTVQIRNYSSLSVFLLFWLLWAAADQEEQCSPCRHLPFISVAQSKGYHTETGHHLVKLKFSCKCHGISQWYMCEVTLACYHEGVVLLVLPIFCQGLCTFTAHFDNWWSICSTIPQSDLLPSLDLEHTCNFPPTVPAGRG